jgi:hypothetical protein
MGTRLIFLGQEMVTDHKGSSILSDDWAAPWSLEIALRRTVPQTDTGGQVENTKALERTMLKELGKIPP